MRRLSLGLVACVAISCKTPSPGTPPGDNTATPPVPVGSAPAANEAAVTSSAPAWQEDGRLPFEYSTGKMEANPGDVVLAPPRQWIDNALERGVAQQTFVYFRAELVEAGHRGSLVRTPSGRLEPIPNALIIRIPPGGRANPGDIVLTAWKAGTGLQRAIVLPGGTPTAPLVHYLDLEYEHPSGVGKESDTLDPNTFVALQRPGEVGTTAACGPHELLRHYIITHTTGDRMIGLGFSGRLRVLNRSDCRLLDLKTRVEEGPILVPVLGQFIRAHPRHYDKKLGRVFVRYNTGKESIETAFGIVNVAPI